MRHGFLLIDKPKGPTSHDVVGTVRRTLSEKNIGHLGTLDPLASGLMVLAVGNKALKIIELFSGLWKEYIVEVTCGQNSTTYDSEGVMTTVTRPSGWEPPEHSALQILLRKQFVGTIEQIPPAYSAIKIGGERAYRKARRGEETTMPARQAQVDECTILSYDYPKLTLRVHASSGTYMRTLAHDIGALLRTGAYMSALQRTRVGEWSIEGACAPDKAVWTRVLPLKDILSRLPRVDLSPEQWKEIGFGRSIEGTPHANKIAWFEDLPRALLEKDPKKNGWMKPKKVF